MAGWYKFKMKLLLSKCLYKCYYFKALIDEDRLLSRIDFLEKQLSLCATKVKLTKKAQKDYY